MRLQELEALTVVILTYNRHNYIEEILGFWSEYPVNLVVVDGTENPFGGLLPKERCRYVHLPASRYQRMEKAAEMVETPFVIQACDDELYSPSALASAVRFLRCDSRYASCLGEAVGFRVENDDAVWCPTYPDLRDGNPFEEDPSIRAIRHLGNYRYPAYYYSVNRTDVWRAVWRHALSKLYPPLVRELQVELAFAFAGNVEVIPEVMWARNLFEPPVGGHAARQQLVNVWDWWDAEEGALDKSQLLKDMSELFVLLDADRHSEMKYEAHQIPALAFEAYNAMYRPPVGQATSNDGLFNRLGIRALRSVGNLLTLHRAEDPPVQIAQIGDCVGSETKYDEREFEKIGQRLLSAAISR